MIELDLARTAVGDALLPFLAGLPRLERELYRPVQDGGRLEAVRDAVVEFIGHGQVPNVTSALGRSCAGRGLSHDMSNCHD